VAKTIASGLIDTDVVSVTSQVILCALGGAIVWNLFTWWRGLPSSSSHALIGGLCGAALAAAHNNWDALIWSESVGEWTKNKGLLWKVFIPMISSPIAGFTLGVLIMVLLWAIISGLAKLGGPIGRLARPRWVNAFFGKAQLVSAAYMGFAHGTNDAQKTMGIIALTIFGAQATGTLDNLPSWLGFLHPDGGETDIDRWIVVACALVMAAGTAAGGWRIIKTMGTRLADLRPIHGFAAETGAGIVIETASRLGFPLSTTHVISSAILGASAAWRSSSVRWGIAGGILTAWILTIPVCAAIGFASFVVLHAVTG